MNEIMAVKKLMGIVLFNETPKLETSYCDDRWGVCVLSQDGSCLVSAHSDNLYSALGAVSEKLIKVAEKARDAQIKMAGDLQAEAFALDEKIKLNTVCAEAIQDAITEVEAAFKEVAK